MVEPLIPATVIGSWSLPGWFEKFIGDVKAEPDRFGPSDREEAVRDAIRLAIDDQLRAGLDRISDGEMQRVDFNLGFYEYLRGLGPVPKSRRWGARRTTSATAIDASSHSPRPAASVLWRSIAGFGRSSRCRSRCRCPVRLPWRAASKAARSTPIARL